MERRTLKWFDESIKILQDAKERYQQEEYLNSYNLTEEAQTLCQRLQSHIGFDVSHGKYEQYGNWGNVTDEERKKLSALNILLIELEKKINEEARRIVRKCEKRLKSTDETFLQDYEVDVKVSYYLDENDPQYSEDRDCILAEFEYSADKKRANVFDLRENWNDRHFDGMGNEKHCWMYHELYDQARPHLALKDLLRIGTVWVDIVARYQRFIEIMPINTETE